MSVVVYVYSLNVRPLKCVIVCPDPLMKVPLCRGRRGGERGRERWKMGGELRGEKRAQQGNHFRVHDD